MDDFERHPLFFAGVTWEDTPDWNDQARWESAYAAAEHPDNPEELGRDGLLISHSDAMIVEALITHAGLPAGDGDPPLRVLDAGCGFFNLPCLVARLGCVVTAVDFSSSAIRLAEWAAPARARWSLSESTIQLLGEEVASRLPVATAPAGHVVYRDLDWFDTALEHGSMDVVYVANSLRLARKSYWRCSLARFRSLLAPGGLLITCCQNAIAISHEVADLAEEAGFDARGWRWGRVDPGREQPDDSSCPRYVGLWPTG